LGEKGKCFHILLRRIKAVSSPGNELMKFSLLNDQKIKMEYLENEWAKG